jgi:UDP-2-acetamido-3-amino-2,3-dideoxy-glucuronate N-acetyltransferase
VTPMVARIHPTALVEDGVAIGAGTSVWDNVHIRGPETSIGAQCIVGEKTYIAYGVSIGDRVKINAFVYICNAVAVEDGVMISAGTTFTNDRYPRATTPDLSALRGSEPDEHTLPTLVREGTTIGARATIGPGVTLGRWSMVGMASVVTRSVPDFHLVVGHPARSVALLCRCGEPFARAGAHGELPDIDSVTCAVCGLRYAARDGVVEELDPPVAGQGD